MLVTLHRFFNRLFKPKPPRSVGRFLAKEDALLVFSGRWQAMKLDKISQTFYFALWLLPLTSLLCSLVNRLLPPQPLANRSSEIVTPVRAPAWHETTLPEGLTSPHPLRFPATTEPTSKKVYYVAPSGDDTNPGSLERPWRTIQKAADSLVAGEVVLIRQGVYSERVRPKNSGKAGEEIVYMAYPGEHAVIDGQELPLPDDLAGLFEIDHQKYLRVSGLHVINSRPYADNAAILVVNSEHITIENNTTLNTASSGIGVWHSQEIVIVGNTVEQAGVRGGQECITVAASSGFEVRENHVVDCQKEGIDAKDGSFHGVIVHNVVDHPRAVGIYVDAWDKPTGDLIISRNIVFDSVESSGLAIASEMGGLLTNVRVENNLAYHNHTYGIEVSACCSVNHPMEGIVIINNTLYQNGIGWGGGILQDNAQAQNVVIRNNLVSQNLTFQIAVAANVPEGTVRVDHNLIDGYRGYEDEVYGDDYVEGEARFLNPSAFDFHLSDASLAIDRGSPLDAPLTDLDGDTRPIGSGYDIGADEWQRAIYLPMVSAKLEIAALSYWHLP